MKKKLIITSVLCVAVLAAVLGGFAIASADDEATTNETTQVITQTNILEKVAEIYEQNTGTAIDPTELQNAFTQAQQELRSERIDLLLQKLVESGKITQEQADQWKAWWDSRPDKALTDEYEAWLEARPDVPGAFGFGNGGMMFGKGGRMFGNMQRFGLQGDEFNPGIRGCFPAVTQ